MQVGDQYNKKLRIIQNGTAFLFLLGCSKCVMVAFTPSLQLIGVVYVIHRGERARSVVGAGSQAYSTKFLPGRARVLTKKLATQLTVYFTCASFPR